MNIQYEEKMVELIRAFSLPKYEEIPNVGLYLEQTSKFVNECFEAIPNFEITNSMISNYVKKGLIPRSIKKCYYRDQIAYLIFITLAKSVLSMDNIQVLISIQKSSYDAKTAYEYIRKELRNMIEYVFGFESEIKLIGESESDEKVMCRNTIIAVAYKMYLELSCEALKSKVMKG